MSEASPHTIPASTKPAPTKASGPIWLLALCYVASFALGAFIDIIRHGIDRIIPAFENDAIDGAIVQRLILTIVLSMLIFAAGVWGTPWSAKRFGTFHRNGLVALFILTPVVVYILEH